MASPREPSTPPGSPVPTPRTSEVPCTPLRSTPRSCHRRNIPPSVLFAPSCFADISTFRTDDGYLRAKRKLRERLATGDTKPFSFQERLLKTQRQEEQQPTHVEEDLEIGAVIGQGSFGTVYRATVKSDGKQLAMKVLTRHVANARAARHSILREQQILASLKDRPYVLQGFGFGLSDSSAFLLTELCDGGSLADVLLKHQVDLSYFSEVALMRLLHHTSLGLVAIHDAEIVHSDIKPANIFIQQTENGPVYKIGDLGHAVRFVDCARSLEPGDAKYMARETLGECKDPSKIDIFSLGVTIMEAATLVAPPRNETPEWHELRSRGPDSIANYSEFFNKVLKWMLNADPESRPTAAYVRDAALQTRTPTSFLERSAA